MDAKADLSTAEAQDRDDFANRLFTDALGAFTIFSVHIGDRLGFYRALAQNPGLTSRQLAGRTGTHERYVREWLEHQATSCVLEAHGNASSAERFHVAMDRALGHFEAGGEFSPGLFAVGLQHQQNREEAVSSH